MQLYRLFLYVIMALSIVLNILIEITNLYYRINELLEGGLLVIMIIALITLFLGEIRPQR